MRRILCLTVMSIFVAALASAADLGKYNDWNQSPAGLFMTKAEREQWATLTTEADAGKFVADFLARRDPGFAAEVAKRAEMADKYLTLGKTAGSKSLRGKVVILFGPPTAMDVGSRAKTTTKRDNPIVAGALSNAASAGGGSRMGSEPVSAVGSISTTTGVRMYTITYSGAPALAVDRKEMTFVIDADAATGSDTWASRGGGKDAEELFELAAKHSIRK